MSTIRKELEDLGWYLQGTGGGCDAFFFDINKEKETHYMMTVIDDASAPNRRDNKIIISVHGDENHICYSETFIKCNLRDVLNRTFTFMRND
jgi:hypothetical protein